MEYPAIKKYKIWLEDFDSKTIVAAKKNINNDF